MLKRKVIVWLPPAITFLALLVLVNLPLETSARLRGAIREAMAPFHHAADFMLRKGPRAVATGPGGDRLGARERASAAEIGRLRDDVRRLRGLKAENAELRRLLGFTRRVERRFIVCEVVARDDVSGWWRQVRLGKGARDGLREGLAVITPEGLAGKTIDVTARTCDVLLLVDPTCRASAHIVRTGAFGIVSGAGVSLRGETGYRMDFIDKNIRVQVGDEVVTSGLGGVFPRALPIGRVKSVSTDRSGLYQSAELEPSADIGALQYVLVLVAEETEETEETEEAVATPSEGQSRDEE